MVDLSKIPEVIDRAAPATPDEVARLAAEVGTLPPDLCEVLLRANGVNANLVQLYSTSDMPERNSTYEVPRYAPDALLIGLADGFPLFLSRPPRANLFTADWGDYSPPCRTDLAQSLSVWIESGCPRPEEDEGILDYGDLYLAAAPPGGLRDLFRLKSVLSLEWAAADMRAALTSTPVRIATRIACVRTLVILEADAPDLVPALAFSEPNDGALLPAENLLASLNS